MKKSLRLMLIAVFVYVLFSFTSVYAELTTIPMVAVTYRLENDGRYKSLKGTTFTSDEDSIDFTYTVTVNNIDKTYTTSFAKNGNIFSYAISGQKTGEDAYYQAQLDDVAVKAMFYAVGNACAIPNDYLKDMSKDFSKYTYEKYGFEVKTYNYTGTINGKAVSLKAVESFKIDADNMSATGISDKVITDLPELPADPIEKPNEQPTVEPTPVEKENEFKSLILVVILVVVAVLIVVLAIKTKKTKEVKEIKKATAKKASTKSTTTKKTAKKTTKEQTK